MDLGKKAMRESPLQDIKRFYELKAQAMQTGEPDEDADFRASEVQ